jgi:hypothetical protein
MTGAVTDDDGPLWYRGYVNDEEKEACPKLEKALAHVGAKRMVVGHTVQESGRIGVRCGGKLLAIDTGMTARYGKHLAAVVFENGDARAVYPDGGADLQDP